MDVMEELSRVFGGKTVLVTGDTGFKGSWLTVWLRELGARVVGFALPPTQPGNMFPTLGLERMIEHVDGDVRELASLLRVFREWQPEFCFHLAAQSLVRPSYADPKLTFDTNVSGSVNLLEAVRLTDSVRATVYVTSDKCYRNREWTWGYRENDELGGRDPYSASKAAAELVFSSYVDSFFGARPNFGIASVRAGNVIGGGDWSEDRIVPDCMRALAARKPIVVRNPTARRPWQHVLEPLSGYLLLAARLYEMSGKYGGAWNFGPSIDSGRTVEDLAQSIVACWGEGSIEIQNTPDQVHEAQLLHLNCDKARQKLDWRPRWNFDRTIEETARWYKLVSAGSAAIDVTLQQIRSYTGAVDD